MSQAIKPPIQSNAACIPMNEIRHTDPDSSFRALEFLPTAHALPTVAIVYLHGSGERGEDLSLVKRYGLPAMLANGRASTNCSVVCPQLESGGEWQPERLLSYMEEVRTRFQQVVLIGYSLGASGVCDLVSRHGRVGLAAVAIAGQGPARVRASQQGVKLVAIQGELDTWADTQDFIAGVNAAGGEAIDIRLTGKGHYISEEAIDHPAVVAALQSAGIQVARHPDAC